MAGRRRRSTPGGGSDGDDHQDEIPRRVDDGRPDARGRRGPRRMRARRAHRVHEHPFVNANILGPSPQLPDHHVHVGPVRGHHHPGRARHQHDRHRAGVRSDLHLHRGRRERRGHWPTKPAIAPGGPHRERVAEPERPHERHRSLAGAHPRQPRDRVHRERDGLHTGYDLGPVPSGRARCGERLPDPCRRAPRRRERRLHHRRPGCGADHRLSLRYMVAVVMPPVLLCARRRLRNASSPCRIWLRL